MKPAIAYLLAIAIPAIAPAATSAAEVLQDPTRPPPEYFSGSDTTADSVGPTLQSVFISPTRRSAIINGQTVVVGDKVGTSEVAAIRDGEVVLRDGKELHSLKLFPNVAKAGPVNEGGPAKKGKKQ